MSGELEAIGPTEDCGHLPLLQTAHSHIIKLMTTHPCPCMEKHEEHCYYREPAEFLTLLRKIVHPGIPERWNPMAACFNILCVEVPASFFFSSKEGDSVRDFQLCARCHKKLTVDHEPMQILASTGEMVKLQFSAEADVRNRPSRKMNEDG